MRVERSNGGSNIDRPESLLKAEALIGENLRRNPNSPTWLQAKARADLLDDNYDSAITTLQRALDVQPDSPSLLTDLGSAYFLRAESVARPIDYGNAVEALSKALAKSPDDPIALFNRAIACERMFLYAQAADDWEHYLRIDPQGGWSDEARRHLAAVKQKVQQHDQSQAQPLLTPAQIAGTRLSDGGIGDKIETRIEEYLHVAIIDWLPQAFPASPSGQNSNESQTALSALAEILRTRHEDSWLKELLSRPLGPQFPSALQALSAALREDDQGDYSEGRDSAHRAAHLFRSAANPAGELRAEGEEVYADHLLWEGERCLSLLRSMNESLNRNSYGWLQAQMSLEESNCANLVGDLGTYQAAIGKGISRAQAHNYPALFLRGLGFRALSIASLGGVDTAFSDASEGLKRFWSGQVDIMKGYNFYYDLDAAADQIHLPNLQVILWREATTLIDRHPDILLRAMAHRWYGSAAYVANMPGLAAAEFSKASALFAASPQTPATTRDHMDAEVWLAQVEIRQGDVERAAARLQAVKPILDSAPSFDPEIGYYSALADVALRKTDTAATESALRSAIFIAEWALNSFRSENDRRHWAEESRNAYRDAVEWKLHQGDAISALEMWEWYRGAGLRAEQSAVPQQVGNLDITVPPDPSYAGPLPSPTLVEDRLPFLREETVITYGVFSDGIAVWVYDNRGVYSQWIPTLLPAVQDQVSRFVRLCSDPASDLVTLRETSAILYKLLVTPVENHIASDRTLVFEPDDFLRAIPWEALVDTKAHYLAERAAVLVTPGLYQAMRLRHSVPITSDEAALVVSVQVPRKAGRSP
ncbi:MAG: CHAT domain-containing protein [Terriglobales bacterium]